jgi:plastocyanin
MGLYAQQMYGQGVEVSGKILMRRPVMPVGKKHQDLQNAPSAANVVVWLSPLKPRALAPLMPVRQTPYRLVQKDKMFTPHLLVVPTGSQVEFPNQDPFFHNVFSLFNGKRFDLGLYESGTSRSVRFDREGASYIFCNIHPEMGAIVLALSTQLNAWSENGQLANADGPKRIVEVSTEAVHLGDIMMQATTDPLANHKNIFGEDYKPSREPKY